MEENILLVDLEDNVLGSVEKLEAHKKPLLHRAFSVFIYSNGKFLIQQRNKNKYHSGGLWANSLCSHPRANMTFEESVKTRAKFEMGIENLEYKELFKFIYMTKFNDNLYEYELDHVLLSTYSGSVKFNPDEVEGIDWISVEDLEKDLVKNPQKYASWFLICAPRVIEYVKNFNCKSFN